MRPDVERLPWGSLQLDGLQSPVLDRARRFWTTAAFQEYRTAAACAATVEALLAAQAPLDLVGVASRFVSDEIAHVEICARIAAELGGGAELMYDARSLVPSGLEVEPLLRAAELIIPVFCVGEAFSLPMQRATLVKVPQPLLRSAWQLISKDEARHARFGWTFLEWANELIDDEQRSRLSEVAKTAMRAVLPPPSPHSTQDAMTLGWLPAAEYRTRAERALEEVVRAPLRRFGYTV